MHIEFEHMPQYLIFEGYQDGYYKKTETIVKMDKVVCISRTNNEVTITLDTHNQPSVYSFTVDEKSAEKIMDLFKQYIKDYYTVKD